MSTAKSGTSWPVHRPAEGATAQWALSGTDPFILQSDGRGRLFAPTGLLDGPLPAHYEPHESPFPNPLYGQQSNPVRQTFHRKGNRYNDDAGAYPYVMTTYRLTSQNISGWSSARWAWNRDIPPAVWCSVRR